jgi:LysM repeat protein
LKQFIKVPFVCVLLLCGSFAHAQTLMGSAESINKQYRTAVAYGYSFVNTASSLKSHMQTNQLVRVSPDRYIALHDVSYPYAVPGTRLFLSRLSAQYYSMCGEKLTVTSLLRPRDRQPANSVARSVHPTGMAVDLRIPSKPKCRAWLENTLLSLERERVLDVTRERYPPHYHVAVYSQDYETRVAGLGGSKAVDVVDSRPDAKPVAGFVGATHTGTYQQYVVRKGDTLSEIATRNRVQVAQLRSLNNLRGNRIDAGQKLRIPAAGAVAGTSRSRSNDMVAVNEITHRVNRGDTLWRIANRYGTSVTQIRQANGGNSDVLQVGQVLKISKG